MRQEATVKLHVSQILNANDRLHWRKEAAMKATLVRFGQLVLARQVKPVREKVRVTFEFRFPVKRRRDRSNLHATVKPVLDGIVKAGVIVDDSDLFIDGPDIVVSDELSGLPGFVLVKVIIQDVRRARLAEMEREIMMDRVEAERAKTMRKAERAAQRERRTNNPTSANCPTGVVGSDHG